MFSDQSAISTHYYTAHAFSYRPEHPDAKHACDVCGRKFMKKSNMRNHLSTVHGVGFVNIFPCDSCPKIFKHKSVLKSHLAVIHGVGDVKRFECDVCSKVFKEKSKLARHVRLVHAGGKVK